MKKTTDFTKCKTCTDNYSMLMSPKHLNRQNVRHDCTSNGIKETANQRLLSDFYGHANNAKEIFQNLESSTYSKKQHKYHRNQTKTIGCYLLFQPTIYFRKKVLFYGTNCSKCQHEYKPVWFS